MKKLYSLVAGMSLMLVFCSLHSNGQAPVITGVPMNDTACAGTTAWFRVATSDTAARFMWETSIDTGRTWDTVRSGGAYSGVANDTLLVSASVSLNGRMFRGVAINDSGASRSASAALFVLTIPSAGAISGASAVCVSSTTMLTNTVITGSWSTTDTTIAMINSTTGGVTPRRAGTASIRYTVTGECGTASATYSLRIDSVLTRGSISGPASVCAGSSVVFTPARIGGGWSVTNGTASISGARLTGVRHGVDTVVYIQSNSCNADTTMATIMVDTVIAAGTISGPTAVCAGSGITLVASLPGGLWLSSNRAVAIPDAAGNVTAYGAGTATISYVFSNACGASVATSPITVSPITSTIVGNDSLGIGDSMMLSDSVSGGTWAISDTNVASITASGLLRGLDTGIVVVTYSATNACGTFTTTLSVMVGPDPTLPSIGGPDSVCAGSSITITNAQAGGVWSVTNASATITSAGVLTGIVGNMIDTVMYTYTNAFGTTSIWKEIKISNTPPVVSVTGPLSVNQGSAYVLIGTPAGGTYTSLNPSAVRFTAGPSRGDFFIIARAIVPLIYSYTNACGTATDTFLINLPPVTSVANETTTGNKLSVNPNPASGSINISLASATSEEVVITITNVSGAIVKEIKTVTNKSNAVVMDQPAGIYLIKAASNSGVFITRVVIQ